MRDINRIDSFLSRLGYLWKTYFPDWRFGQFMFNFISSLEIDPFFIEDDKMIEYINNYVKQNNKGLYNKLEKGLKEAIEYEKGNIDLKTEIITIDKED
jgi:hypothetical protein